MNVVIQPAAEADIVAHIDYLLEEYAYDAAERFPVAFGEAIEFIRANPTACPQFAAFRSWALPGFPRVRLYFISEPGRMDFHSQDGVLAAQALADDARRHYAMFVHALVLGLVTVCAVIGRPAATVLAPVGYLIGASISHVVWRVTITDASARRSLSLRAIRRLLQRPVAGVVAASPAVLPLLLLRSIEPGQMATIIGLLSATAALLLTMVDHSVVRFMTESGYSAGRIIGIHARPLLMFLVLTVPASLILSDRLVTLVLCGVAVAALIFMTSRVLAYRVYSKRTADTLVSICGIVCLSGVAMPMVLPVVVFAILWQLYRRAVPVTWLLT